MRILLNLKAGIILLLFTATCKPVNDGSLRLSGIVEQQGITTYQYGSHTLSGPQGFYALTSKAVNLDHYIGKEITIKAEKVEGYPVDGGPEYLRVLQVVK